MPKVHEVDQNLNGVGDAGRIALLQDTKVITVRVGSGADAWSWMIHKKLLIYHSPYFAAALGGSFSEATTDSIDLNEDDARAFELFVQWLYTGKASMTWGEKSEEYELNSKVIGQEIPDFASVVWALGDKLACPAFQDHAMILIVGRFQHELLDKGIVRLFYQVSSSGSRLRKLAVDQFLWDVGSDEFDSKDWDYPDGDVLPDIDIPDFTEDVAKRLIENRCNRQDPSEMGSRYLQVLNYNYEDYKKDVEGETGSEEE
ncbi:MAG: hypothetical protein Q9200_003011 [Gallowayella weberi]